MLLLTGQAPLQGKEVERSMAGESFTVGHVALGTLGVLWTCHASSAPESGECNGRCTRTLA